MVLLASQTEPYNRTLRKYIKGTVVQISSDPSIKEIYPRDLE